MNSWRNRLGKAAPLIGVPAAIIAFGWISTGANLAPGFFYLFAISYGLTSIAGSIIVFLKPKLWKATMIAHSFWILLSLGTIGLFLIGFQSPPTGKYGHPELADSGTDLSGLFPLAILALYTIMIPFVFVVIWLAESTKIKSDNQAAHAER